MTPKPKRRKTYIRYESVIRRDCDGCGNEIGASTPYYRAGSECLCPQCYGHLNVAVEQGLFGAGEFSA